MTINISSFTKSFVPKITLDAKENAEHLGTVDTIIHISEKSHKDGLLQIESEIQSKIPTIARIGLTMVATGEPLDVILNMLKNYISASTNNNLFSCLIWYEGIIGIYNAELPENLRVRLTTFVNELHFTETTELTFSYRGNDTIQHKNGRFVPIFSLTKAQKDECVKLVERFMNQYNRANITKVDLENEPENFIKCMFYAKLQMEEYQDNRGYKYYDDDHQIFGDFTNMLYAGDYDNFELIKRIILIACGKSIFQGNYFDDGSFFELEDILDQVKKGKWDFSFGITGIIDWDLLSLTQSSREERKKISVFLTDFLTINTYALVRRSIDYPSWRYHEYYTKRSSCSREDSGHIKEYVKTDDALLNQYMDILYVYTESTHICYRMIEFLNSYECKGAELLKKAFLLHHFTTFLATKLIEHSSKYAYYLKELTEAHCHTKGSPDVLSNIQYTRYQYCYAVREDLFYAKDIPLDTHFPYFDMPVNSSPLIPSLFEDQCDSLFVTSIQNPMFLMGEEFFEFTELESNVHYDELLVNEYYKLQNIETLDGEPDFDRYDFSSRKRQTIDVDYENAIRRYFSQENIRYCLNEMMDDDDPLPIDFYLFLMLHRHFDSIDKDILLKLIVNSGFDLINYVIKSFLNYGFENEVKILELILYAKRTYGDEPYADKPYENKSQLTEYAQKVVSRINELNK
jgi:hypothetical protein